ncbi:MAG: hypothetical protein M4579_002249 [Chaenotheca gracillima]|nr:MAG: hypothetical protein M4579_002249 [Chaenotheca gracillima]
MTTPIKQWHRGTYLISTAPELLSHQAVNTAFADPALYWAHALEPADLARTLQNSLCFGLYQLRTPTASATDPSTESAGLKDSIYSNPEEGEQIGLARVITDHVTFAYLTDVYVVKEHQGKGLGRWLGECVDEVVSDMPDLRRIMLATGSREFWRKVLHVEVCEQKEGQSVIMSRRGRGGHVV